MLTKRIIPCLDVKDGRVVKGINFINLRDAGDPVEQAKIYDQMGADELVFLDISATAEGHDTTLAVVQLIAEQVFLPLTVGGGIRTVDDTDRPVDVIVLSTGFRMTDMARAIHPVGRDGITPVDYGFDLNELKYSTGVAVQDIAIATAVVQQLLGN